MDQHVGPAGDGQEEPEVAGLPHLVVLGVQVIQLDVQLVVLLDAFLVSFAYLAVGGFDLLLVQVCFGEQGAVQLVADVVGQDEDLRLVADQAYLLLHRLDVVAVFLHNIRSEKLLAIL